MLNCVLKHTGHTLCSPRAKVENKKPSLERPKDRRKDVNQTLGYYEGHPPKVCPGRKMPQSRAQRPHRLLSPLTVTAGMDGELG
jgi:hypothetical protein